MISNKGCVDFSFGNIHLLPRQHVLYRISSGNIRLLAHRHVLYRISSCP